MKKLFIVLSLVAAFLTATAFISANKSDSTSTQMDPPPSCQLVGNCSVNLEHSATYGYYVLAENHNDYPVNVHWKAYGYDSNTGKKKQVGGSTIWVAANGNAKSSYFKTNCEDVSLAYANVERCK